VGPPLQLEHGVLVSHASPYCQGRTQRCVCLLERGLALAREWNLTTFFVGNTGTLGYVHAVLGRTSEGIPSMEHAISAFETIGHRLALSFFLGLLGEAYVIAGRLKDALEAAGKALAFAREGGQRPYEARALRLLGDVAAARGSQERADGHYRDALALAEELGMRPLVAHCHLGLAKLYRRNLAQQHLTTAANMYRTMDMQFFLKQVETETPKLRYSPERIFVS
jgi:tetratricopeptide (TPR) repeat protein